jgi:membrane-associated phospholipid phosphatase
MIVGPRDEQPAFVLATTLIAAFLAVLVLDPGAQALLGGAKGVWRSFLKTLTNYGEGVEILVASAAIVIFALGVSVDGLTRRVRAAIVEIGFAAAFAFAAVAGSGIAASLIKNAIGRTRPEHVTGSGVFELHPLAFSARFASFPSGHATTAGATAMVLALLFPKLRWPIVAAGIAVALSRILLDAHYPSDVVAGFGFGVAFTLALAQGLARRNLVFRQGASGRLEPKAADRPGNWPDVLAALIARAKAKPTAASEG